MVVAKNMIQGKYHTIIDEYPYDRQELEDLYYRELEDLVVQYGAKMRWGPEKRQSWRPGINAVDPTLRDNNDDARLTDYPEIKKLFDAFNFTPHLNPDDLDILVYDKQYEFVPHVDFKQNCVIMFPILPADGGTPITYYTVPGLDLQKYTKFHDLDKNKYRDYVYKYSTEYPTLSNGMCIHGVDSVPKDETRVYLRVKILKETYEDIVKKLNEGTFVK